MKKTLDECIEQYKFYSSKYCDAHCNHETEQAMYYSSKLFELMEYTGIELGVNINDYLI